jgi:transposase
MKKPAATKQKEKTQIEQLSQAELVEMVLGLQKIIAELQEKLAIATGKSQTTSQTSSKPPSTDLIQKPEKPVDETPWCVMGVKEWLWTASGEGFCLFHAADTRGRVELETMLGKEFAGVLSSDDFSVYNGCQTTAQQKCLAHLRRHFKKVLGLPGNNNNAAVAQVFLSLIDEAFKAHESWRKTKERLTYDDWADDFKIRLNLALATWLNQVGYAAGLLLKSLRDKAEQWWYFLDDPSVPPDNNLAERSLRLAVTKRKVSGGSRSMKRFEETADLLSVIQTCRFQARSVMTFFREAISAHSCHFPRPELIPLFQT